MAGKIQRSVYADMFGPTTGDRVFCGGLFFEGLFCKGLALFWSSFPMTSCRKP